MPFFTASLSLFCQDQSGRSMHSGIRQLYKQEPWHVAGAGLDCDSSSNAQRKASAKPTTTMGALLKYAHQRINAWRQSGRGCHRDDDDDDRGGTHDGPRQNESQRGRCHGHGRDHGSARCCRNDDGLWSGRPRDHPHDRVPVGHLTSGNGKADDPDVRFGRYGLHGQTGRPRPAAARLARTSLAPAWPRALQVR